MADARPDGPAPMMITSRTGTALMVMHRLDRQDRLDGRHFFPSCPSRPSRPSRSPCPSCPSCPSCLSSTSSRPLSELHPRLAARHLQLPQEDLRYETHHS